MALVSSCKEGVALTGAQVVTAEDDPAVYEQARQLLIKLYPSWPKVVVFVESERDVQNALCWAQIRGLQVRVRGGRCSTIGACQETNAVVVDVSSMKSIELDIPRRRVRIGAGVTQGEAMNALSHSGYYTALGSEGILGLIGVILGGGIGLLSRHKGPGCDSLLSLTTVLADGTVRDSRADPDLLWASRGGGGGNFGVVTSFTMRLYRAPRVVVKFDATWSGADRFVEGFTTWQDWVAQNTSVSRLSSNSSAFSGRFEVHGVFLGSEQQLGDLLSPLRTADVFLQQEIPFSQFFTSNSTTAEETQYQYYGNFWVPRTYPARAVAIIADFVSRAPAPRCSFFSLAWGANTRHEPKGGAAFPLCARRAQFYSECGMELDDAAQVPLGLAWARDFRTALEPYTFGAYVNVLMPELANYGPTYYGKDHFERLKKIKKRVDPGDFWVWQQSVPSCGS